MVFVQALWIIISDRHEALTGQVNNLIKDEVKTTLRMSEDGEGIYPEKTIELLTARPEIKDLISSSVRGDFYELKNSFTVLKSSVASGKSRATKDLSIVEKQAEATKNELVRQIKIVSELEKKIDLFTNVMNSRLEYYRQLQLISDMVAPYQGPNDKETVMRFFNDEEVLSNTIATLRSKRRHLEYLRGEANNPVEKRICIICRDTFEVSTLTVCSHQYCKKCIDVWSSSHHNCPICKRKLYKNDLHQITYKPKNFSIMTEHIQDCAEQPQSTSSLVKSAFYHKICPTKLAKIKDIKLSGPSCTSKIWMLGRHLIWLRSVDPGAKIIIYPQYSEFLNVLGLAFQQFQIKYTSMD
ncbi:hypothetical protein K3495_g14130 [Podosphaera aphanis]|nr:hypothetical protein K3495_g14130 [Podosphaera aphanis]